MSIQMGIQTQMKNKTGNKIIINSKVSQPFDSSERCLSESLLDIFHLVQSEPQIEKSTIFPTNPFSTMDSVMEKDILPIFRAYHLHNRCQGDCH